MGTLETVDDSNPERSQCKILSSTSRRRESVPGEGCECHTKLNRRRIHLPDFSGGYSGGIELPCWCGYARIGCPMVTAGSHSRASGLHCPVELRARKYSLPFSEALSQYPELEQMLPDLPDVATAEAISGVEGAMNAVGSSCRNAGSLEESGILSPIPGAGGLATEVVRSSRLFFVSNVLLGPVVGQGVYCKTRRGLRRNTNTGLWIPVAVKYFFRSSCQNRRTPVFMENGEIIMASAWDKLWAEIQFLSQLDHLNICKLYEVLVTKSCRVVYLIMEYGSGQLLTFDSRREVYRMVGRRVCSRRVRSRRVCSADPLKPREATRRKVSAAAVSPVPLSNVSDSPGKGLQCSTSTLREGGSGPGVPPPSCEETLRESAGSFNAVVFNEMGARHVLLQVLKAVRYLQSSTVRVVHKDIKMENVMLSSKAPQEWLKEICVRRVDERSGCEDLLVSQKRVSANARPPLATERRRPRFPIFVESEEATSSREPPSPESSEGSTASSAITNLESAESSSSAIHRALAFSEVEFASDNFCESWSDGGYTEESESGSERDQRSEEDGGPREAEDEIQNGDSNEASWDRRHEVGSPVDARFCVTGLRGSSVCDVRGTTAATASESVRLSVEEVSEFKGGSGVTACAQDINAERGGDAQCAEEGKYIFCICCALARIRRRRRFAWQGPSREQNSSRSLSGTPWLETAAIGGGEACHMPNCDDTKNSDPYENGKHCECSAIRWCCCCQSVLNARQPGSPRPAGPIGLGSRIEEDLQKVSSQVEHIDWPVVKLIDFNCAVQVELPYKQIYDSEGTRHFTPPECLKTPAAEETPSGNTSLKRGTDGYARDMWSCGCLLFCLLFGLLPFEGAAGLDLIVKIWLEPVRFPPEVPISSLCRDLLMGLLCKDPSKRLTVDEALEHPWFRDNTLMDSR